MTRPRLLLLIFLWTISSVQSAQVLDRGVARTTYHNGSIATPTDDPTTTITTHTKSTVTETLPGCSDKKCFLATLDPTEFVWPSVSSTEITLATIIYRVNNVTNTTSTITKLSNATLTDGTTTTLDVDDWASLIHTPADLITIVDDKPTLTLKVKVYTDATASITVTTNLVFPASYYNAGFRYATETQTLVTGEGSETCDWETKTFAVKPTVTPPGCATPYQCPISEEEFHALIPPGLLKNCSTGTTLQPLGGILTVKALTDTTTEYDSFVHSNSPGPTPPKETPNSPPSQNPQPAPSQPAPSQPAPSQPVPSQPVPTQSSPSQPAAPIQPQPAQPAQPQTPSQQGSPSGNGGSPNPNPAAPPGTTVPAIILGGTTIPLPPSGGAAIISGQTIQPGGPPATIGGTVISLPAGNPSNVVVGGSTQGLGSIIIGGLGGSNPAPTTPPAVVLGSQTLTAGAPGMTINNTPVSVVSSGSGVAIVVGGSALSPSGTIVIGGSPIAANPVPSNNANTAPIIIGGQTITPGASAVTIFGTPVSVAPSGTAIVVGGSTITPGGSAVIGSSTITLGSSSSPGAGAGALTISGQTLTPGGSAVVISGTTYSLPASLAPGSPTQIVVNGQTITAGSSALTVNGTPVSLSAGASGTGLVEGSTTLSVGSNPTGNSGVAVQTTNGGESIGSGMGDVKVWGLVIAFVGAVLAL